MFIKKSLIKAVACAIITLGASTISHSKPFVVEGDKAIEAQKKVVQLMNYGVRREKAERAVKALFLYPHTMCAMAGMTLTSVESMSDEMSNEQLSQAATLWSNALNNSDVCDDDAKLERQEHASITIGD